MASVSICYCNNLIQLQSNLGEFIYFSIGLFMDIKLQFLFVINIAELNLRRLNQIYKTTKRVREFCVIT